MIDLNHPGAEDIFKASALLDKIKKSCHRFILQGFEQRQASFSVMEDDCLAFLIFAEQAFPDRFTEIAVATNGILAETERLRTHNQATQEGRCMVCNNELRTFDPLLQKKIIITFCQECPKGIFDRLEELELYTGAAWM